MQELLVASHNPGKVHEYRELLPQYQFVGLADIGLSSFEVEETGTTFMENAALKATQYARASGRITLADDSGLCVDALDGEPGLYSARYGGPGLDDAERRAYLLSRLAHVPEGQRTAQFVCVIALHDPRNGRTYAVEGVCSGHILLAESAGQHGFGYDRLFVPQGHSLSFADMEPELKNQISHRGIATQKIMGVLKTVLG